MHKLVTFAALTLGTATAAVGGASAASAGINIGNNWCAAPWSWPGPASTNAAGFSYDSCNDQSNGYSTVGVGGTDVANNWCAAPWEWEGPLAENIAPFVYKACDSQHNDTPIP